MVTTPTLPLFDEPATPSRKPSPDDSSIFSDEALQICERIEKTIDQCLQRLDERARIAHVDALAAQGKLTFGDPVADLHKPWWETMTEAAANETLARYEREAHQTQSLAASLDQFDELETYDFDSDGFVAPADERW